MIESAVATEVVEVSENNSPRIKRLVDPNTVCVGDCLVGIVNEVTGEKYVIHITPGSNHLRFLDDPLSAYHIQVLLTDADMLTLDEIFTTVSYVREYRQHQFYPWCDEAFFYRPVYDKARKVIGIEVSAQNNNDFILTFCPKEGWSMTYSNSLDVVARFGQVNGMNPIIMGSNILVIIHAEHGIHFPYSINQKVQLSEDEMAGVTGSILVASFATTIDHLMSYGVVERALNTDPEAEENGGIAVSITNPDGTIDYSCIPLEYIQSQLH